MSSAPRSVSLLGSTGSIGCSTVDLLRHSKESYRVRALVGGANVDLLARQARELLAEIAVINDESRYAELKEALSGSGIACAAGRAAVLQAASMPVDWTMAAITGAIGLEPTLAATQNGGLIALANKEALVSAGDVMLQHVAQAGATLLPVDSEHNAIFQCLAGEAKESVEKIILTASGGPFRNATPEAMACATPEQALKHPVWSMGAKITIDSASMANKGLEIIEAARLFGFDDSKIDVLVHPQSTVHSLVQFVDGSVLAQLGSPDMRIPIAHTLAWPKRMSTLSPRLDLAALGKLEFQAPCDKRFPCLRLATEALRAGGAAPAIYSASNEIAVDAFLQKRIGFLAIADVIAYTMDQLGAPPIPTLEAVLHWDEEARRAATAFISQRNEPGLIKGASVNA